MQRYLSFHPWLWAMALCGLASMFSAHYQQFAAYAFFKPLAMVIAMAAVWQLLDWQRHATAGRWLLVGLLCSMVGDVCLLTEHAFVPGLLAFLCAHCCYIVLFRRDRPWKHAAWSISAFGVGVIGGAAYMYLYQHGLPEPMRIPVAAYVLVIGLMVAQALARGATLRTPGAWYVALGALSFMVSDTVLAFNKFVAPLAAPSIWILSTYYLAQCLIVHGMLQATARHSNKSEQHTK